MDRAVPVLVPVPPVSFYRYLVWAATGRPWVAWWVWMVVRFVSVIRVPVFPVCVPAPPGVFLPVPGRTQIESCEAEVERA